MLGQRVPAFIILINAAKLLYVEMMPVTALTLLSPQSLFPHPVANTELSGLLIYANLID